MRTTRRPVALVGRFMVDVFEPSNTDTGPDPNPNVDLRRTRSSCKGGAEVLLDKECVGRPRIDAAGVDHHKNIFWTSWVHYSPAPTHEYCQNFLHLKIKSSCCQPLIYDQSYRSPRNVSASSSNIKHGGDGLGLCSYKTDRSTRNRCCRTCFISRDNA